jgi:nucleoside-diphosphate-sugar epimerase
MSKLVKYITITGASGFIGRNLSSSLLQNPDYVLNPINLRESDISQRDLGEVVVHLAGKAHDTRSVSPPEEYFAVNTGLCKKLFDAFLKSSANTFIYISSVKAVADQVEGELVESIIPNPKTPYGQSKQQAEAYVLSAELPLNKRVFILRPCMIHGPGNKGNLNLLYKFVQKGIPYPLAAFNNKRSFLSIANLNYVIEAIISREDIQGGVYNVADDEPLATNAIIKIICETIGLKARLWQISPNIVKTVARVGDKLHLPLNSERLKKLTESYIVSNKKIKAALEIDCLLVSSSDGLRSTIQSFNANIEPGFISRSTKYEELNIGVGVEDEKDSILL